MVGFTEYSATLSSRQAVDGQTVSQVHVYVENAIATAGATPTSITPESNPVRKN